MKKRIIISIAVVLVVIAAVVAGVYYTNQVSAPSNQIVKVNNIQQLTYKGKNGTTALALLQQAAKIKMSGTGEMAYVTSINGVAANPKNQYWQLNVNGESATVGAGSLITKSSDTITWKLSSF
jgi:hypothetical protein